MALCHNLRIFAHTTNVQWNVKFFTKAKYSSSKCNIIYNNVQINKQHGCLMTRQLSHATHGTRHAKIYKWSK